MERELKVGEIVTIDGVKLEVKQDLNYSCDNCYFKNTTCVNKKIGCCTSKNRSDKISIYYSKLEETYPRFTKSDLKSGMVVELDNGYLYLVVDDLLIRDHGFLRLDHYNNNLEWTEDSRSEYRIKKIYQKSSKWGYGLHSEPIPHEELLWDFDSKDIKENKNESNFENLEII